MTSGGPFRPKTFYDSMKARGARGRAAGDAGAQSSALESAAPGAQGWPYPEAHLPLGVLSLGRAHALSALPAQRRWLDSRPHSTPGTAEGLAEIGAFSVLHAKVRRAHHGGHQLLPGLSLLEEPPPTPRRQRGLSQGTHST